jgi:glycogen debranching enzyme
VKGPTWPPLNLFLSEALEGVGHTELAIRVRRGFLESCLRHGMSEHFDARTGAPGGDPGYIWTAALFLRLGGLRVSG